MISLLILVLYFVDVHSKVYFKEEFSDDNWTERWIASEHSSKDWGKFVLSPGRYYGDPEISKGIKTSEDFKFYGLTAKFEPFSNKDKTLVIQFSVKHEQEIKCGGAYLKLFDCNVNPKNFHSYVPYLIMFGPDICGSDKKVHVIFKYNDRILRLKRKIQCKHDRLTHVYTLIIKPDNTYVVKIDNKIEQTGILEEDWDFLPPKKNANPKFTKPDDWDDNPKIEDPTDKKPEDWDQPEFITDPNAAGPLLGDNDAWEPPLIRNPAYKGEWKPKLIDNPNYKGPWIQPLIDNPHYVSDPDLYKFDEICAVGFDLWQVESGTIFDNILLTDNELEAEKHSKETWGFIKHKEKGMKIIADQEIVAEDTSRVYKTESVIHDEF